MVKVNIGDYVKFRKIKKIQDSEDKITKGKWYKVEWTEVDLGFDIIRDDGKSLYISTDEIKYVKKIKKGGKLKW